MISQTRNVDAGTAADWGAQWEEFDHSTADAGELRAIFNGYFQLFPWEGLSPEAEGFDIGCGTGRWARFVAQRVGRLHCIEVTEQALEVARRNLSAERNCVFHLASVDDMPLTDNSMDFGYAIGVFHYVPDPPAAMKSCVAKLKPGAPLLLYVYYAVDNRPGWYRAIWRCADLFRRLVARFPFRLRLLIARLFAVTVYYPLSRFALLVERSGENPALIPLCSYRRRSLKTMCSDALARFGYRLEHRFTKEQLRAMMQAAGLERIEISDSVFWSALGRKRAEHPQHWEPAPK